jgi:hypothetical protein
MHGAVPPYPVVRATYFLGVVVVPNDVVLVKVP